MTLRGESVRKTCECMAATENTKLCMRHRKSTTSQDVSQVPQVRTTQHQCCTDSKTTTRQAQQQQQGRRCVCMRACAHACACTTCFQGMGSGQPLCGGMLTRDRGSSDPSSTITRNGFSFSHRPSIINEWHINARTRQAAAISFCTPYMQLGHVHMCACTPQVTHTHLTASSAPSSLRSSSHSRRR